LSRAGPASRGARTAGGFTLVEVVVAIAILGFTMTAVYQTIARTQETKDQIESRLEAPKMGAAILDQLFKDFRHVYYREGLFPTGAGFWGRSRQTLGRDSDRVDFVTARTSRIAELEDAPSSEVRAYSPLTEVGYAVRPGEGEYLELWRREDYWVDDDPTDGGKFSLVTDRLHSFKLRYFPIPEENKDEHGLEEWNSTVTKKVPYAVILDIQYWEKAVDFAARERPDPQRAIRILLLKAGRAIPLDAGMGMDTGMTGTPGS
jgi:prepilin-type N-terminal cleavage/methylation domain-containing protein